MTAWNSARAAAIEEAAKVAESKVFDVPCAENYHAQAIANAIRKKTQGEV